MQRRKALAAAGAITATATAAVIALGANLGLFGLTGDQSGPGSFKLVDQATPVTQVVDIPVPVTAASGTGSSPSGKSYAPQPTAPTVAPSSPSYSSDDDYGHEDEHEDEHEEDDD